MAVSCIGQARFDGRDQEAIVGGISRILGLLQNRPDEQATLAMIWFRAVWLSYVLIDDEPSNEVLLNVYVENTTMHSFLLQQLEDYVLASYQLGCLMVETFGRNAVTPSLRIVIDTAPYFLKVRMQKYLVAVHNFSQFYTGTWWFRLLS